MEQFLVGLSGFGPLGAALVVVGFLLYRGRAPGENYADNMVNRVTKLEEAISAQAQQIASQERKITALEYENRGLRNKLQLMESNHQSLPIPMWMKDTDGTMLTLNSAYESTILLPLALKASDYVGSKDANVWPDEVVQRFHEHDAATLKSSNGLTFCMESVPDGDGGTTELFVVKYLRRAGGVVVGISGLAIPVDYFKEVDLQ